MCAMVKAPSPEEENRRRVTRKRKVLDQRACSARQPHQGAVVAQGISGYEPLRRNRRRAARSAANRRRPSAAKASQGQIGRELDRLELLLEQVRAVETQRDATVTAEQSATTPASARMLLEVKGVGPEFAAVLSSEGLFPPFRQSKADCSLRRPCTDALTKWVSRSRARPVEIRQPAAANDHDPTRLVVAAPSTALAAAVASAMGWSPGQGLVSATKPPIRRPFRPMHTPILPQRVRSILNLNRP